MRHDSAQQSAPIFIMGAPRSGTTLLVDLLNMHEQIFVYDETKFFDFYATQGVVRGESGATQVAKLHDYMARRVRFTASKQVEHGFGATLDVSKAEAVIQCADERLRRRDCVATDVFRVYMECAASIAGKQRWAEKTPQHVFYVEQIGTVLPDALFLHITRDPRSFLRSYKYAWRIKYSLNTDVAKRLYHPLITSLLWRRAVARMLNYMERFPDRCLGIRYEDLVDNPPREMARVLEFIGERSDGAVMSLPKGSNTSGKDGGLSTSETRICEFVCGKAMENLGYAAPHRGVGHWMAVFTGILSLPWYAVRIIPVLWDRYGWGVVRYVWARARG